MKILLVGGYGTFGGRLVDLLVDRPDIEILVAGRNLRAAQEFCATRRGRAKADLTAVMFDRAAPLPALERLRPDLVVDASGPFQVYGAKPYALVEAAIACGCNYADLADGADFVLGIAALDQFARAKGVCVVSGMSSFPVLTSAVGRVLARELDVVDEIRAGIAPSPYAGVGGNVIRAIASYAGRNIKIRRNGVWTTAAALFDSTVMQVNVPGSVPLPPVRFALTEVPDLQVLSLIWPEARSIWVGAGPTPAALHKLLWCAAGLVKLGLVRSLLPIAPVMNFVVNTIRWGEHRGGLIFEMTGRKFGVPHDLSWHLLAEGDSGPLIPSMAVAALVTKMLQGHRFRPGARSGHLDLDIADFQPWFDRYNIKTGRRSAHDEFETLYQAALGEKFPHLASPLQQFHSQQQSHSMIGQATISGGNNLVACLIRRALGLPSPGTALRVCVKVEVRESREVWLRQLGRKQLRSVQFPGSGKTQGLIVEQFGALRLGMAAVENEGRLELHLRNCSFGPLSLPRFLLPRIARRETGADGRFNFQFVIRLALIGEVFGCSGWLVPPARSTG